VGYLRQFLNFFGLNLSKQKGDNNLEFKKFLDSAGSQAPQFVGKFQSVTINEGDSLRLYCKAVPDVQSMQWFRDGTPLSTGGNYK
jgi:hypothetical protein